MRTSLRHSTSNPVTALLAVQLFMIGVGYSLTRLFVHFWNKTYGPQLSTDEIDWGRLVARFGLWSLLLPVAWGAWAVLYLHASRGGVSTSQGQLLVGIAVALLLLLFFGWTIGGVLMALGQS